MIGKILGDRYEILEKIGQGGMAVVYKAKCNLLNRFVAIKILKDEFIEDKNFNRKFERESQAVASLSHPNILNIYDVGAEEFDGKRYPYIVMEYIKGKTLKQIIKEKGKLSEDETIYYTSQIAEGLKHAHDNNVIHRDIKPQNIMITEDNRVKVTDFGIARAATAATITTDSNALGSVHYFSPEQARGGYTDETTDIYSLGIVMYEMLTGRLPYNGDSSVSVALKHIEEDIVPPRELDDSISPQLEAIILKCVQKSQGDRYKDIDSFISDLRNLESINVNEDDIDDSPTRVMPVVGANDGDDKKSVADKGESREGNGKTIALAVGLAFLLVAIAFFGYFKLRGIFDIKEVIVPNMIGVEEAEAEKMAKEAGLNFEVEKYVNSDEYEEGEVIWQNVDPESKVKEGFTIKVHVSEGEELIRVPGLINHSLEEAIEILEEAGLRIGTTSYQHSDTTPKDVIMKQDPEAYTYLAPGSKVNVVISEGEEIKRVVMPKLVGENIADAKNKLLALGLRVGDIIPRSSDTVAVDRVMWQSHDAGTELDPNTVVSLYISTGPEQKPEPEKPKPEKPKPEKPKPEKPPKTEGSDKGDEDQNYDENGVDDNGEADTQDDGND